MLTNLLSQVGKINMDGNKTHTCFYLDKMREYVVGKNKATTPSLAFPFCLKSEIKQGNFLENVDMCFRIWNKEDMLN